MKRRLGEKAGEKDEGLNDGVESGRLEVSDGGEKDMSGWDDR